MRPLQSYVNGINLTSGVSTDASICESKSVDTDEYFNFLADGYVYPLPFPNVKFQLHDYQTSITFTQTAVESYGSSYSIIGYDLSGALITETVSIDANETTGTSKLQYCGIVSIQNVTESNEQDTGTRTCSVGFGPNFTLGYYKIDTETINKSFSYQVSATSSASSFPLNSCTIDIWANNLPDEYLALSTQPNPLGILRPYYPWLEVGINQVSTSATFGNPFMVNAVKLTTTTTTITLQESNKNAIFSSAISPYNYVYCTGTFTGTADPTFGVSASFIQTGLEN